jgi:hypothetical protein
MASAIVKKNVFSLSQNTIICDNLVVH